MIRALLPDLSLNLPQAFLRSASPAWQRGLQTFRPRILLFHDQCAPALRTRLRCEVYRVTTQERSAKSACCSLLNSAEKPEMRGHDRWPLSYPGSSARGRGAQGGMRTLALGGIRRGNWGLLTESLYCRRWGGRNVEKFHRDHMPEQLLGMLWMTTQVFHQMLNEILKWDERHEDDKMYYH